MLQPSLSDPASDPLASEALPEPARERQELIDDIAMLVLRQHRRHVQDSLSVGTADEIPATFAQ